MDSHERAELLAQYRSGYDAVEASLDGITAAELDRRPAPDSWTAREVVHHLADSETQSYTRLRKVLAEDDTLVQAYDEPVWAVRLHYGRPINASLAVLKAVRESTLELLESLSEAEWQREGRHSTLGRYTLDIWLVDYAEHPYVHAAQITRARRGEV